MTQQLQEEVLTLTRMDLFYKFFATVPILVAIISTVIVLLVGWYVIKPDKMVRIIFPFIRKKGINTVVFGFILTKRHINGLFSAMFMIIGAVIWTFCGNILIFYKNKNNLFSATSIVLQCFNDTITNLTAIERPELEEDTTCYAINFNIAGAMGQATGALAFGWAMTAILTWIILNVNYKIKQHTYTKNNDDIKMFYKWLLFISLFTIILRTIVAVSLIIIGLYCYKYDCSLDYTYYIIRPENELIFEILIATQYTFDVNIKKEPKSLEEHCRELFDMKKDTLEEKHAIKIGKAIIDAAKLKYIKIMIKDMEEYLNEDIIQTIAAIAFYELTDVSTEQNLQIHKKSCRTTMCLSNKKTRQLNKNIRRQKRKRYPLSTIQTSGSATAEKDKPIVATVDVHTAKENEETSV